MKSHTVYKTFNTDQRREFVRITEDVQRAVDEAGVAEGMAVVSAMHITAGVWVNDDEPGIQEDALEWLHKLAPPNWQPPPHHPAQKLLPPPRAHRQAGSRPPTTWPRSSCPIPATTATTAAARTTATRTSRTCWCTTRWCC